MGILNNEQRKERGKAEFKIYIEENTNRVVDPTIFWDTMKVVIRGNVIAETTHIKRAKPEPQNIY